jgi:hypothetical protein
MIRDVSVDPALHRVPRSCLVRSQPAQVPWLSRAMLPVVPNVCDDRFQNKEAPQSPRVNFRVLAGWGMVRAAAGGSGLAIYVPSTAHASLFFLLFGKEMGTYAGVV